MIMKKLIGRSEINRRGQTYKFVKQTRDLVLAMVSREAPLRLDERKRVEKD